MLTDRAFACLLIAALLLCGAARYAMTGLRQETEAAVSRRGSIERPCPAPDDGCHIPPAVSRGAA